MIEKPKRPKKIPNQDNKQPQTIQELTRRYDLDNTKVYDFLDELVGSLKETQTIVSPKETTGDKREKVWMQKGKNIFNKNNYYLFNGWVDMDGKFTGNINAKLVYINCLPNTQYTVSREILEAINFRVGSGSIVPVSGGTAEQVINGSGLAEVTLTTKENDKYIYVYLHYDGDSSYSVEELVDKLQIEQGENATEYEAYVEPTIYVKNGNGVYEEFINKEKILEVYSTREQVIGTWIDGKPIYRTIIPLGNVAKASQQIRGVDDLKISLVIKQYGIAQMDGADYHWATVADCFVFNSNSNRISYYNATDATRNVHIILEYTKTTD